MNPKTKPQPKRGPRGGHRPGAGRKPGTGAYGEPTLPLRIPASRVPAVRAWLATWATDPSAASRALPAAANPARRPLPLFSSCVAAGFPSPADDHLEKSVDLNESLVRHPAATYFVRVDGDSMAGAGIHNGDVLVVDRSIEPRSGAIVVAAVGGELTVKRLRIRGTRIWLVPENPKYRPMEIREGYNLSVWGVVVHSIRSF